MSHQRWILLISGKVQGVYYRATTQARGTSLGLTGYARNLPDGRVEIIAEGPEDRLEELRIWCHDGPEEAEVTSVERVVEVATNEFSDFGIRR